MLLISGELYHGIGVWGKSLDELPSWDGLHGALQSHLMRRARVLRICVVQPACQ